MSSLYYVGVGVLSLASTIYNFEMWAEGKNVTCYDCQNFLTDKELDDYRERINGAQELYCTAKKYPLGYSVLVKQTDAYRVIALIIAIMYLLLLVLAIYEACVTNALSNQTPEDFIKMGRCKRVVACICKIFPMIILIISWINFILIVVDWILYGIKYCNEAINRSPDHVGDSYTRYRHTHMPLMIVNSVIWACLHIGGSIIREMTYIEPFMYDPAIGDESCCKTFFLRKFGP